MAEVMTAPGGEPVERGRSRWLYCRWKSRARRKDHCGFSPPDRMAVPRLCHAFELALLDSVQPVRVSDAGARLGRLPPQQARGGLSRGHELDAGLDFAGSGLRGPDLLFRT